MIFHFSGTGNSAFVAEKIAEVTKDSLYNLNQAIGKNEHPVITDKNLVFCVPTYAWRIPTVVEKWIENTQFPNAEKVWFVMTCGGEIGNAEKYIKLLCEKKKLPYMGVFGIVMPENYIAMFSAPCDEKAVSIVKKAMPEIRKAAECIRDEKVFPAPRNNLYDKLMSTVVNPLFYKTSVKATPFYVKDACIGCGKCREVCPLHNIEIKDGKPHWKKNCTHCMACISSCPAEAIEYGKKSVGQPRYRLEKIKKELEL